MKKIFLYSSLALTAFLSSCSELDDNISPNNVDPSLISPRQTLSASQNLVMSSQAGTLNSLSNVWTNTWAGNNFYFGNPTTREYSLDISNTFGSAIWSSSYNAANNLQQIINNGSSLPLHSAIAKILKAYTMQYVVDFYGDAPYSEAFQGQSNLTPRYDDDAAIYRGLVTSINEAIATIDATTTINGDIVVNANEDTIFGGDMQQWRQFANNIKLKLLLRQSKVTDTSVRAFVDAQLQTLAGSDLTKFCLTDVGVNPGYSVKNSGTPNPLFNNYGAFLYDGSQMNTNGWRLYKAAQYYANSVNGVTYGAASRDVRGSRIFRRMTSGDGLQSPANVLGIQQGAPKGSGNEWSSASYLGGMYVGSQAYVSYTSDVSTSNVYYGYYYADLASRNDLAAKGGSENGYLALASENELLLAEAAVLYPTIFTFDAETRYNQAVADSFDFYGLLPAHATSYLAGINTTSVGWTLNTNKIAAIQFQRLASLAGLRSVETYINYLKTGYPTIPVALTAIYPNKPYRLIYPSSEYIGNSSNVPNVSQAEVFAKNSYTPFWNQN